MSEFEMSIGGSVGSGGRNDYFDSITIQHLVNHARTRINQPIIGVDGKVGNETITAISDFQKKSFGVSDGRVDKGGRSFRKLWEIYNEPPLSNAQIYPKNNPASRFKVTMGEDGRIVAQPNDWLSKYSAAINGTFWQIWDFGHMVNGKMVLFENPNLIRAGQIVYHLPTYQAFMGARLKVEVPKPPPISKEEKSRLTKEAVKQNYNLKGDVGIKAIDKIAEALDYGGPLIEIISIFTGALGGLATALAIIAVPFQTYAALRDFVNASDTDLRMYGLRAAAYGTTAWAFGDVPPTSSPAIRKNLIAQFGGTTPRMIKLDQAFKDAVKAGREAHELYARTKFAGSATDPEKLEAWKAALRGIGDNDRKKLCTHLMNELANEYLKGVTPTVRRAWDSNMSIKYPS